MSLLDSELEHVLVNCVNALRMLCDGNHDNQTAVAESSAIDTLTELLSKCGKCRLLPRGCLGSSRVILPQEFLTNPKSICTGDYVKNYITM